MKTYIDTDGTLHHKKHSVRQLFGALLAIIDAASVALRLDFDVFPCRLAEFGAGRSAGRPQGGRGRHESQQRRRHVDRQQVGPLPLNCLLKRISGRCLDPHTCIFVTRQLVDTLVDTLLPGRGPTLPLERWLRFRGRDDGGPGANNTAEKGGPPQGGISIKLTAIGMSLDFLNISLSKDEEGTSAGKGAKQQSRSATWPVRADGLSNYRVTTTLDIAMTCLMLASGKPEDKFVNSTDS
eukprot:scaffold85407_cov16-Prasinocladus_malaysianus.AAC.1